MITSVMYYSLVVLFLCCCSLFFLVPAMSNHSDEKFIKSFADTAVLKDFISNYIAQRSHEAITQNGAFVIALSGGSMPKLLSGLVGRTDMQWNKIYVLFADERCCSLNDDDSNFKACNEAFFAHVPLPAENILTIESYEDPDLAAQQYEDRLQQVLGDRPIDMVLLGLGPDGHTASLFPSHELLNYAGNRKVVPIFDSPKPPSRRITLTLGTINSSKEVVFIATGEGKAQRLYDILSLPSSTSSSSSGGDRVVYPPTLVQPARLSWLIDDPAATLIKAHTHIEFISQTQDPQTELGIDTSHQEL